MPPVVLVDERWLLDVAQNLVPGDPDVTDYGAPAAAVARHRHEVMDTLVYPAAHHRAAAPKNWADQPRRPRPEERSSVG
ncbi:hypothetical protein ACH4F6_30650 [Streptomyces sp. NPDC017936]|uniref:hypothetical protein n=1 Tax=Streptomyces sp. NPDC017936 TaxID=3365016 RepID=UPI0037A6DF97